MPHQYQRHLFLADPALLVRSAHHRRTRHSLLLLLAVLAFLRNSFWSCVFFSSLFLRSGRAMNDAVVAGEGGDAVRRSPVAGLVIGGASAEKTERVGARSQ
jgi:hypothetical protein